MIELLKVLSTEFTNMNINYDHLTYKKSPLEYPYVVSSEFVSNYIDEERKTEGEIVLNCFDRSLSSLTLINLEEKIKNKFRNYSVVQNDVGINLSFMTSFPEEQEDDELKKKEIRLDFVFWERSE